MTVSRDWPIEYRWWTGLAKSRLSLFTLSATLHFPCANDIIFANMICQRYPIDQFSILLTKNIVCQRYPIGQSLETVRWRYTSTIFVICLACIQHRSHKKNIHPPLRSERFRTAIASQATPTENARHPHNRDQHGRRIHTPLHQTPTPTSSTKISRQKTRGRHN